MVGIHTRVLRDLSIDLNRTRELAPRVPHGVTVISDSGINTYGRLRELSRFANGFLIGSALMSEQDLSAAVRRVLLGDNKICGLTRAQDAKAAYEAGAIYGGLIFVESSPRFVTQTLAKYVQNRASLMHAGVFLEESVSTVLQSAPASEAAPV